MECILIFSKSQFVLASFSMSAVRDKAKGRA
jgi:hypothetical protein